MCILYIRCILYTVFRKSKIPNILQSQPKYCTKLNKIVHVQSDIWVVCVKFNWNLSSHIKYFHFCSKTVVIEPTDLSFRHEITYATHWRHPWWNCEVINKQNVIKIGPKTCFNLNTQNWKEYGAARLVAEFPEQKLAFCFCELRPTPDWTTGSGRRRTMIFQRDKPATINLSAEYIPPFPVNNIIICDEHERDMPYHHVAGLKTSSWEGHHTRHSGAAVVNDDCEHSPSPWGDARQSADYVGTSRRCVSISI